MVMNTFPFDRQALRFTLGPWTNSEPIQNTTFPGDNSSKFVQLLGVKNYGDGSSFDAKRGKEAHFIATEEWRFVNASAERSLESFPCCTQKYAILVGTIELRRTSRYYVKFGVLPQILMTMTGLVAHAFTGHRAGSVAFIAGTGFTVALALTAHAVFFIDQLPVVRDLTYMEFTFIWSFSLSLAATCFSLYLFKKIEVYEVKFETESTDSDGETVYDGETEHVRETEYDREICNAWV
jgi:hypothetical protein